MRARRHPYPFLFRGPAAVPTDAQGTEDLRQGYSECRTLATPSTVRGPNRMPSGKLSVRATGRLLELLLVRQGVERARLVDAESFGLVCSLADANKYQVVAAA